MKNNYFAGNLKHLRLSKNMYIKDICKIVDKSVPLVSRWEKGEKFPKVDDVFKLANFFHIAPEDLVSKNIKILDNSNYELTSPQAKIKIEEIIEMTSDLSDQEKMLLRGTLELICKDKDKKA